MSRGEAILQRVAYTLSKVLAQSIFAPSKADRAKVAALTDGDALSRFTEYQKTIPKTRASTVETLIGPVDSNQRPAD